ncbi:hypothetical protein [Streptomyces sp. NPDC048411]|uniref:hypothetical protein n=1 Tax=Streptomyces sp. NPDC048411 TaxID=3157206 RepID=UPI0034558260
MEVASAPAWPTLPSLPSPGTIPVVTSGLAAELAYALGGPFHFLLPDAFTANLIAMQDALADAGVDGFVYYAKKANKAAVFVDRAATGGAGVDVASTAELREALGHGVRGEHLMVTGPAKDPVLLRLAVTHSATIAVDALDELDQVISLALTGRVRPARVLLRALPDAQPHSRFGMSEGELTTALKRCLEAGDAIRMEGFSFHLSGYALQPRADLAARLVDLCLPPGSRAWRPAGSPSAAACPSAIPTPTAGTPSSPRSVPPTTTPARRSRPATSTRTTRLWPARTPWRPCWRPARRTPTARWRT